MKLYKLTMMNGSTYEILACNSSQAISCAGAGVGVVGYTCTNCF